MSRVRIIYADGESSYGDLILDEDQPCIEISGERYDLETFGKTEATVAVNDINAIKTLLEHGVKARPTPTQEKITISVPTGFKDRLTDAAKEEGRTVSSILTELASNWLKQKER